MRRAKTNSAAVAVAVLAAALLTQGAASADVGTSIGAGAFFASDGNTYPGIVGTVGLGSFPVIPIRPQVTGAYIFTSGGNGANYAITGEGQFGGKTFYAGAGAGYGRLPLGGGGGFAYPGLPGGAGPPSSTSGVLIDGFIGAKIAKYASVQFRYYASPDGNTGNAAYLGLSLGF
jgi:hypothetical protein